LCCHWCCLQTGRPCLPRAGPVQEVAWLTSISPISAIICSLKHLWPRYFGRPCTTISNRSYCIIAKAKRGISSATIASGPPLPSSPCQLFRKLVQVPRDLPQLHLGTPVLQSQKLLLQLSKQLFVDDPLAPGIKVAIALPPEHGIFPKKVLEFASCQLCSLYECRRR
jgi:hypothetical protein